MLYGHLFAGEHSVAKTDASSHGDWFWELHNKTLFPRHGPRKPLLQALTRARREVLDGHENQQYRQISGFPELDIEVSEEVMEAQLHAFYGTPGIDRESRFPDGLKNRLRIWLILESTGRDGGKLLQMW